jgi:nicotinamidase-related amidase
MPLLDRADSLLVVVDAQPGFIDHHHMSEHERAESAAALQRALWLAGLTTLLEAPAVVVEEGAEREGGTDARLLERLPPDTPVLAKDTFSLAARPEIVEAIRATERHVVVLVGFETDTCVAHSAIELHDLGFRAVVVADATYAAGGQHQHGLARMSEAGVERNHCKGVTFEWLRTVEAAMSVVRNLHERFGARPPWL